MTGPPYEGWLGQQPPPALDPRNFPEPLEQTLAFAFNSPGFIGTRAALDDVRNVVAATWGVSADGSPIAYAVAHDTVSGPVLGVDGHSPLTFAEWWTEQRKQRPHWFE